MTAVKFRIPRCAFAGARGHARGGDRPPRHAAELLGLVGEQGLLVFCAILAMPFLLPVTLPFMSTALGLPMLLIGDRRGPDRVPWLPDRLLDPRAARETVQHVLERAVHAADRFEHLVRPRLLALTATPLVNSLNGIALVVAVLVLMAPSAAGAVRNTAARDRRHPAVLGMAERDGRVILFVYVVSVLSTAYVGTLLWLAPGRAATRGRVGRVHLTLLGRLAGG